MTTNSLGLKFNRERKILALKIAQSCANLLINQFGAKRVILFGSLSGQTPWHDFSDIDLAVEGLPEGMFFNAYSACRDILPTGLNLDLVPLENTYPEIRARILQGQVMKPNSVEALKSLIDDELISLERIVNETQTVLNTLEKTPNQLEMNGLAAYLHQYYTGLEAIFRRIAIQIDGHLPTGDRCDLKLLNQMAEDLPKIRTALIEPQQDHLLKDYLSFRHFFRHAYGYQLRWSELSSKLVILPENFQKIKQRIDRLFQQLTNNKS
jgi:predicted nucleotidyltransferase